MSTNWQCAVVKISSFVSQWTTFDLLVYPADISRISHPRKNQLAEWTTCEQANTLIRHKISTNYV